MTKRHTTIKELATIGTTAHKLSYYKRNKSKRQAYYAKNRDKYLEYYKQYYIRHREKMKAASLARAIYKYYEQNKLQFVA